MSNLVRFLPRPELKRDKILDALVSHYKKLLKKKPFDNPWAEGGEWKWGDWRWAGLGRFLKLELAVQCPVTILDVDRSLLLDNKTLEQIQALVLHDFVTKDGVSRTMLSRKVRGLLLIESVLRKRSPTGIAQFSSLKATDLENAVDLYILTLDGHGGVTCPVSSGRNLLVEHGIVTSGAAKSWVNTRARLATQQYTENNLRTHSDHDNKLPSLDAIKANAIFFREQPWLTRGESPDGFDNDPRNVVCSAVTTIMSLVPIRANELLRNAGVHDLRKYPEKGCGEVMGINWHADKTNISDVKWIPYITTKEFEIVIQEAWERIKWNSGPARALLRTWDSECTEYCEESYLNAKKEGRLPPGFPWFNEKLKLRFRDAMFVTLKYQMASDARRLTIQDQVEKFGYFNFRDHMRGNKGSPSFFERLGFGCLFLDLGEFLSHNHRHMVNTAARLGGMSELDVNMWSSRKSLGEAYNHSTGKQRRNLISHGHSKDKELTPQERLDQINDDLSLTRKNLGLKFELAGNDYGGLTLTTPLGVCIHNYAESPCMKSVDCAMCTENLHCKGNKRELKNLREELERTNDVLKASLATNDSLTALNYEVRSEVLAALVKLLGDNSPLADGDYVILSPEQVPKSGLIEHAKMVAEQIKKNQGLLHQEHSEISEKLGVVRELPQLKSGEITEAPEEDDFGMEDLLIGFEED